MTASDKIDKIVTNRWLAFPIFAAVMFLVYYISVTTVGTWVTDWTNDVLFGELIPPAIEQGLLSIGCADWLTGLVLDGIVAGVGAVLGFVPQMFVSVFVSCIFGGLRLYGARGVYYGQNISKVWSFWKVVYPDADQFWLWCSGDYGIKND